MQRHLQLTMGQIKSFEQYVQEHTPRNTAELICIHCMKRWIGVWPEYVYLKDITCPYCNTRGTVITTGQMLEDDYE